MDDPALAAVFGAALGLVRPWKVVSVTDAFCVRRADNERRATISLPPQTRRRRRTTLAELAGASSNAPP